jgi:hypothetical protein
MAVTVPLLVPVLGLMNRRNDGELPLAAGRLLMFVGSPAELNARGSADSVASLIGMPRRFNVDDELLGLLAAPARAPVGGGSSVTVVAGGIIWRVAPA